MCRDRLADNDSFAVGPDLVSGFLVPEISMARNPYDNCTHARKEKIGNGCFQLYVAVDPQPYP